MQAIYSVPILTSYIAHICDHIVIDHDDLIKLTIVNLDVQHAPRNEQIRHHECDSGDFVPVHRSFFGSRRKSLSLLILEKSLLHPCQNVLGILIIDLIVMIQCLA